MSTWSPYVYAEVNAPPHTYNYTPITQNKCEHESYLVWGLNTGSCTPEVHTYDAALPSAVE